MSVIDFNNNRRALVTGAGRGESKLTIASNKLSSVNNLIKALVVRLCGN